MFVLDMRRVCDFCDYFVLASGNSLRQVNALAEAVRDTLNPAVGSAQAEDASVLRIKPLSRPRSDDESGWIALDYGSVVVHLFHKPIREFYDLERLWSDAKRVRIPRSV